MKYPGIVASPLFFLLLFASPSGVLAAARPLSLGLSGADVTSLQKSLAASGYLANRYATGYFGPLTETALKKFQCDKEIVCSGSSANGYGVYGPKTQTAMATALPASRQAFSANGSPLT